MARKYHTTEQIIGHLRQAEVMLSQGKKLESVLREIGVTANTYYRWRKDYGGMGMDQAGQPPIWSPGSIGTFVPDGRAVATGAIA
jgi:putative transposase